MNEHHDYATYGLALNGLACIAIIAYIDPTNFKDVFHIFLFTLFAVFSLIASGYGLCIMNRDKGDSS